MRTVLDYVDFVFLSAKLFFHDVFYGHLPAVALPLIIPKAANIPKERGSPCSAHMSAAL